MACAACSTASPALGWLCDECSAAIHGIARLSPEQIVSHAPSHLSHAALIDRWGRPHPLGTRTIVGRQFEGGGVVIADASVSRRHAEIVRKRNGTWWVVDLVSSNGTTVAEELVDAPRALEPRTPLFFGEVGFFFVTPDPGAPPVPVRPTMTHRPGSPLPDRPAAAVARIYDEDEEDDDTDGGAYTWSGLRSVDLVLASPTGGGGGVVELNGRTTQLTAVQYALIELLAVLPWDTPRPEDNHIKQLVRRARRALVRANLGDLIESRQGFGYRLRVLPRAGTARS